MSRAHFETYKVGDGHRWRLRAANGEIIASGESYTTHDGCVRGIHSVRDAIGDGADQRIETVVVPAVAAPAEPAVKAPVKRSAKGAAEAPRADAPTETENNEG